MYTCTHVHLYICTCMVLTVYIQVQTPLWNYASLPVTILMCSLTSESQPTMKEGSVQPTVCQYSGLTRPFPS